LHTRYQKIIFFIGAMSVCCDELMMPGMVVGKMDGVILTGKRH